MSDEKIEFEKIDGYKAPDGSIHPTIDAVRAYVRGQERAKVARQFVVWSNGKGRTRALEQSIATKFLEWVDAGRPERAPEPVAEAA